VKLSDFDYDLPERYIAQTPVEPRDASRLLIYDRVSGKTDVRHFRDIVEYLRPGDVLVVNNTRVMPARLFGKKVSTGATIEVLLLKKLSLDTYEVLVKPLKRLTASDKVLFAPNLGCALVSKNEGDGTAVVRFNASGTILDNLIEHIGTAPLPGYIKNNTGCAERYQTVYSKTLGSAAAPTAGLHWTPELLKRCRDKGVIVCEVLLHVGLGTFRPVKCENITEHKMHSEYYEISSDAAQTINMAKQDGRRVICVGTTSLRTLEGNVHNNTQYSTLNTQYTGNFAPLQHIGRNEQWAGGWRKLDGPDSERVCGKSTL